MTFHCQIVRHGCGTRVMQGAVYGEWNRRNLLKVKHLGPVAELADALDSGSSGGKPRGGSTPLRPTLPGKDLRQSM